MLPSASSPSLALAPVPSSGTVAAASAPIPGEVQAQLSFWTSCEKCDLELEYLLEYTDHTVVCPKCHIPVLATEKLLNVNKGSTAKVVRRRRKKNETGMYKEVVAGKNGGAVPDTGSAFLQGNMEHGSYIGVPVRDVPSPRIETFKQVAKKGKRQDQLEICQADHKVYHVASSQKLSGHQEEASPEDIFAALTEIPGLARDDLLTAYSSLTQNNRMFRSLLALPLDMRKDWLLIENRNKMARMKSIMYQKDMF